MHVNNSHGEYLSDFHETVLVHFHLNFCVLNHMLKYANLAELLVLQNFLHKERQAFVSS